jgi:hypothetical protein
MTSSSQEVDETFPECEASLVMLSDTLGASELEALVSLSPDRSTQKGEITGAFGRARSRFSMWEVTSRPGRRAPEAHVIEVLDRVRDCATLIRAASQDPRVHSVSFWILSQDPEFAFDLEATRVMEIARLGASLKIKTIDVRGS